MHLCKYVYTVYMCVYIYMYIICTYTAHTHTHTYTHRSSTLPNGALSVPEIADDGSVADAPWLVKIQLTCLLSRHGHRRGSWNLSSVKLHASDWLLAKLFSELTLAWGTCEQDGGATELRNSCQCEWASSNLPKMMDLCYIMPPLLCFSGVVLLCHSKNPGET